MKTVFLSLFVLTFLSQANAKNNSWTCYQAGTRSAKVSIQKNWLIASTVHLETNDFVRDFSFEPNDLATCNGVYIKALGTSVFATDTDPLIVKNQHAIEEKVLTWIPDSKIFVTANDHVSVYDKNEFLTELFIEESMLEGSDSGMIVMQNIMRPHDTKTNLRKTVTELYNCEANKL